MLRIRDPLYGTLELSPALGRLIDLPAFQRLRRISQLGLASLVTPSATHTRFEHAVGVHHMARKAVAHLQRDPLAHQVPDGDWELLEVAALTHDMSHYVGAHFLEEVGLSWACHEAAAVSVFADPDMQAELTSFLSADNCERLPGVIAHKDPTPLANVLSSGCDVDKLDYLQRDLWHAGYPVPVDRDGILQGFTLLRDPVTDALAVGLSEDALPAFEGLLFAKYMLYRRVLFATPVRAATAMLRALLLEALTHELLDRDELMSSTDQELLGILRGRVRRRRSGRPEVRIVTGLMDGLQYRRLYPCTLSLPVHRFPRLAPETLAAAEAALATALGTAPGTVLLDIPWRPNMLDMDVLVRMHSGQVVQAAELGADEGVAIRGLAEAAYRAASRASLLVANGATISESDFWQILSSVGVEPVATEG
jgi:hypothetical protein